MRKIVQAIDHKGIQIKCLAGSRLALLREAEGGCRENSRRHLASASSLRLSHVNG